LICANIDSIIYVIQAYIFVSLMKSKKTPVLEQYLSIKKDYKDCILFYRIGEFYELLFDDAVLGSEIIGAILTKLGGAPMCGVPARSVDLYTAKLIKAGKKVAICEQLEQNEGGVLKREVVRVVTAGTVVEEDLIQTKKSNYLASVVQFGRKFVFAWIDLSSNNFFCSTSDSLLNGLEMIMPSEIVLNKDLVPDLGNLEKCECTITTYDNEFAEDGHSVFQDFYKGHFLYELNKSELLVSGILIKYLISTKNATGLLSFPQRYAARDYMLIDHSTRKNLELHKRLNGERSGSLIDILDRTKTGAGARLLAEHFSFPLMNCEAINDRLEIIDFFLKHPQARNDVRNILSSTPDFERAASRINLRRYRGEDFFAVREGLKNALQMSGALLKFNNCSLLRKIYDDLGKNGELMDILDRALYAYPESGHYICPDFHPKLREIHEFMRNKEGIIRKLREKYRKMTTIKNLEISYHNFMGYYVEIPAQHTDKMTNKIFIYKQSLAKTTRYITDKLKDLHIKLISFNDLKNALEKEIFAKLRTDIMLRLSSILVAARAMAKIDVASALAQLAAENNYTRPSLDNESGLVIKSGRHPMVEQRTGFVGNDLVLDEKSNFWLITAPNMAGKSTFLRQNALIVVMAQAGCFVPADSATIGLVDKVFSRIGAGDDISAGHSTFMVEMSETAAILKQATSCSLVILDELGRGTSTRDGVAIAAAVAEYIHDQIRCKTLFATHYHELVTYLESCCRVNFYSITTRREQGKITFCYRLGPGSSLGSYGVDVAELAGVPSVIISKARLLLEN
jgi:DNA mismatch repair protein MutS